jgi:putative copper resistance protein D
MAEFLVAQLHGLILVALSLSVGGVAFILGILKPVLQGSPLAEPALRSAMRLVILGACTLAVAQAVALALSLWSLASEFGHWPWQDFWGTSFARAGAVRAILSLCFAVAAIFLSKQPDSMARWFATLCWGTLVLVSGAWLVHATSRLENVLALSLATLLHQLAAALWVGGVLHLFAFWRLARRYPLDPELWPLLLRRFSPFAALGVTALIGAGLYLGWNYVGSWGNLTSTAYGVMVLAKLTMLATALFLARLNFVYVRRWIAGTDRQGVQALVPTFIEAESVVLVIVLLTAVTLTSAPPAIDVGGARPSMAEISEFLQPTWPQFVPPPRAELMADYSSPLDYYSPPPSALDRLQSKFNHNVSGLLVFVVGFLAILDRAFQFRWARHWPLSFFTLGIFLLVYGQPSSWPLGDEGFWETLASPSVLQHRIATLLVFVMGFFEWRVQVGGLAQTRWRYAFPILGMIGGAVLFTHTHPQFETKTLFFIELSHGLVGLLAIMVGVGRWLELRLPPPANRGPGILWTTSLLAIGLILLFYREV